MGRTAASSRAEREQLREQMRKMSCTVPQIAAEMARRYNLRPRTAWRHALGWTQAQVAMAFNDANDGATIGDNRVSEYEVWPSRGTKPPMSYLTGLARTFDHGCTVVDLVDAADMAHLSTSDRRQIASANMPKKDRDRPGESAEVLTPTRSAPADVGLLDVVGTDLTRGDVQDMQMQAATAASRALRQAILAESETVGAETMSHITSGVAEIARAYPQVPVHDVLGNLIEIQDLIFRLLDRPRGSLAQYRDLYLYGSMSAGMLAKASHDMADPRAAMMQARTAHVLAEKAGHAGAMSWTRGLQSLIAYWAGRPGEAATYAAKGISELQGPSGSVSAWLPALRARAAAQLGDGDLVREMSSQAAEAREVMVADDLDGLGGILGFAPLRQDYYLTEAAVLLGDHDQHLAEAASDVAAAYATARERHDEQWAFGDEAGAWTNLALAQISRGDLEAAAQALRPVLDLPQSQHIAGIVGSAQRVHRALVTSPDRTATPALEMRDELELFTAAPAPALPR